MNRIDWMKKSPDVRYLDKVFIREFEEIRRRLKRLEKLNK